MITKKLFEYDNSIQDVLKLNENIKNNFNTSKQNNEVIEYKQHSGV